jgi:hypothetical protein
MLIQAAGPGPVAVLTHERGQLVFVLVLMLVCLIEYSACGLGAKVV